jgi:lysozyme
MNAQELKSDIRGHEGWSPLPYRDGKGRLTIGYGFLIDPDVPGAGLTKAEGEMILNSRLQERIARLENELDFFNELNDVRQRALINMSYQLGVAGLLNFTKMIAAIREGDWDKAHAEALDSQWHRYLKEEGSNRSIELARMIRDGTE